MCRLLIAPIVAAAAAIVAAPEPTSAARKLVEIVDYQIVEIEPGMTAFVPLIALNRGIDTASRTGAADFQLQIDLIYTSAGMPVMQSVSVPVRDTVFLGYADVHTPLMTTFIFAEPVVVEPVEVVFSIEVTTPGK